MSSKLPALFQRLSSDDWARVRAAVESIEKGDVEAVACSPGYIDVGRSDGGQPYIGGMSMDARGGGGLAYRKVPVMLWPKAAGGGSVAGRMTFAGIAFRSREGGAGGRVVLVPVREADWWRLSSHQSTTDATRRRDALIAQVIREAQAATGRDGFEIRQR